MLLEAADTGTTRAPGTPRMRALLLYLGLALIVIGSVVLDLHSGDALPYLDENDYEQVARSILHRHEFADGQGRLTLGRPPGYPAVIALAYSIVERPLAARFENAIFFVLAVLSLAALARRITPGAGMLVPFLVLFYPLLIYAASLLYPQTFGCLLLSLIVMLTAAEPFTPKRAVLTGILYGILILAIPAFLLLLPLFALFVIVAYRGPRLRAVLPAGVLFAVACLVVAPWTVRNYQQFHVLVPVSANGGTNLFLGNSPATTANSGVNGNVWSLCPLHPNMTEHELDAAMQACAIEWIKGHPGAAARLYVAKVFNYFNFRNELATAGEHAHWRDWLIFATYYPLLLIALWRAALYRRLPFTRIEALIYLVYFLNAFVSAIFFTRLRFRIPFDFLLIGVDAAFLVHWWTARAER